MWVKKVRFELGSKSPRFQVGGLRVDGIWNVDKDVEVILGRLVWLYIGKLT